MNYQTCNKHGCALISDGMSGLYCQACQAEIAQSFMPPTNKPKMPEVIYASERSEFESFHKAFDYDTDSRKLTPYHHDDKVRELKEALRECLKQLKKSDIMLGQHLQGYQHIFEENGSAIINASNLLK